MKNKAPTGSEKYLTEYQNLSYKYLRSPPHPTSFHMEAANTKASLRTLKIFRSKKQDKLQRLLNSSQINPDNLNNNRLKLVDMWKKQNGTSEK